jgi:hypothetical protein
MLDKSSFSSKFHHFQHLIGGIVILLSGRFSRLFVIFQLIQLFIEYISLGARSRFPRIDRVPLRRSHRGASWKSNNESFVERIPSVVSSSLRGSESCEKEKKKNKGHAFSVRRKVSRVPPRSSRSEKPGHLLPNISTFELGRRIRDLSEAAQMNLPNIPRRWSLSALSPSAAGFSSLKSVGNKALANLCNVIYERDRISKMATEFHCPLSQYVEWNLIRARGGD